jgi:hypothetical protein
MPRHFRAGGNLKIRALRSTNSIKNAAMPHFLFALHNT